MSGLVPLPGGGSNSMLGRTVQRRHGEEVKCHSGTVGLALFIWLRRARLASAPSRQPVAQTRRIGVSPIRKLGILPLKVKPLTALRA